MVVPTGKKVPGSFDFVQTKLPCGVQLSVAEGSVQLTMAPQLPGSVPVVISDGQPEITGAKGSVTVTIELQVALPNAFETVSITLFVPRSEQLNEVRLNVFVIPQPELLPLSTIGTVSVAVPDALRLRDAFLHSATMVDSIAPVE